MSEHFLIFNFQNAGSISVAKGGRGDPPGLDFRKEILPAKISPRSAWLGATGFDEATIRPIRGTVERTRTLHGHSAPKWSNGLFGNLGKLFADNEKVGRGGGDRTHDLRLKRPLLYH